MKFDEYQAEAASFCRYPARDKLTYYCLGLAGETGEVMEKVKKIYRDKDGCLTDDVDAMRKELGDVMWYMSRIASAFGLSLEDVAVHNIQKLSSRRERGTLKGSGDNR